MSKAEQRALEAYPPKYAKQERHPKRVQSEKVDTHQPMRTIYIEGYRQAEKDLELKWKDMMVIDDLLDEQLPPRRNSDELVLKGYYEEVLKRFKYLKDEEIR